VAKRLRYVTTPVLLVVNKSDTPALDGEADGFYRFARKIVRVSAKENRGKTELLDAIFQRLPELSDDEGENEAPT
jgi:GTPase